MGQQAFRGWKPKDVPAFIEAYMRGDDNTSLAQTFDGSFDQTKRFIRYLRENEDLPSRVTLASGKEDISFEYRGTREKDDFIAFLSRAKTQKEIEQRFGSEDAARLLDTDFAEYELFQNRNNYNEKLYSLLPIPKNEITLLPKAFKFHKSKAKGEDDLFQPYLLINLDEKLFDTNEDEEIRLIPLFDVHLGNHAHKAEKFLAYIRYIQENDHIYTWIGGDLMENALDDGRGMTYEQNLNPGSQLDYMCALLAPIAHKIFFGQPGNHEWRSYKVCGLDPMQVLCERLHIPYFDGPVYMPIVAGDRKWVIYSQHGTGNSQTKGGKMNSAGRPRKFTNNVDFFVSGHVHDPVVNSETVITEDPNNSCMIHRQQWTVICPSFLGFDNTYAYRAGYAPPGAGGISIHLYKNGDYEAVLRNRS